MHIAVLSLFTASIILFVLTGLFRHSAHGQLRSSLIAQASAVTLGSVVRIVAMIACQTLNPTEPACFDNISNLAFALGGAIGLSIITYINTGRWHRGFYFLALFSLLPDYGIHFTALLWLVMPFTLRNAPQPEGDSQFRIMIQTIRIGTLGGGLLFLLTTLFRFKTAHPFGLEIMGPLTSMLFLYAGLHAQNDPENEFVYPEVANIVRIGLLIAIPLCAAPHLLLEWHNGLILSRFLISAFNLITCFILILLTMHFDSSGIRMFLILLILAIVPEIVTHLYHDRLIVFVQNGLHLVSRTFLILACLFILKQYLRWGFEIVQTMVMIITAVSAASIVFLVIYVLQPDLPLHRLFAEDEILTNGILLINFVVLLSLPPVLLNYSLGTMRVTWAILTLGVFTVVYTDFLPKQMERYEHDTMELIGTGLVMLAFMTLWRYINSMIMKIQAISKSLDLKLPEEP